MSDQLPKALEGLEATVLSDRFCDYLLDELIVSLGGERGFTSDKLPLARWDMKAALRKALLRLPPDVAQRLRGEGACGTCGGTKTIRSGECSVAMSGPTCRNPDCPPCQTPELDPCPDCTGRGEGAVSEEDIRRTAIAALPEAFPAPPSPDESPDWLPEDVEWAENVVRKVLAALPHLHPQQQEAGEAASIALGLLFKLWDFAPKDFQRHLDRFFGAHPEARKRAEEVDDEASFERLLTRLASELERPAQQQEGQLLRDCNGVELAVGVRVRHVWKGEVGTVTEAGGGDIRVDWDDGGWSALIPIPGSSEVMSVVASDSQPQQEKS